MSYYFSKILKQTSIEEAYNKVAQALKSEGFGILTEIDIAKTFKKKMDVDFKKYLILGACNPHFAYKAITAEDKIGVFLPCNVVITETGNGDIEVAAVDPISSMMSVKNESLGPLATEVQKKMQKVVELL